jgi:peptidoglycan/LPS O-acetylase OafA/YrhL
MKTRLEYFDYGRFFAIIGVILVHTAQFSHSSFFIGDSLAGLGRFGVQLFFIISGSTIYLSYNSLIRKTNNPIMYFYVKRLFRIIPLFIVMGIYYSFKSNFSIIKVLSPLSGFDPRYLNAIDGGASIWLEIYFYLLFPLYFFLRNTKLNILFFSLACLIFANLIHFRIYDLGTLAEMKDFDYLNIFSQFICFILGVEFMARKFTNIYIFIATYTVVGFLIKWIFFREYLLVVDYGSSYWLAIISAVALTFTIYLKYLSNKFVKLNNFFVSKLVAKIGQMTYTSYMVHFIVIDIIRKNSLFDFGTEINFIIISLITFLLSHILKPWTENIFDNFGSKLSARFVDLPLRS